MRRSRSSIAAAAGIALTLSASAHHSFGMFDMRTMQTWTGTVESYDWKNPHVWIYVNIPADPKDPDRAGRWGFEGASPNILSRQGFSHGSFVKGDPITVTGHPMKDGSKAGSFAFVIDKAGHKMFADPGAAAAASEEGASK